MSPRPNRSRRTRRRPAPGRAGARVAPRRRRAGAGRGDRGLLPRDARAELVRSLHRPAADHALRRAVRDPRRAGPPAPRPEDGAEPGRVVDGERRRARLRVQAAPRPQVPQRRRAHHRRREVELRALPGRGRQGVPGARAAGGDRGSARDPVPPEGALAGLHDLLRHHRLRRRHRAAPQVRRAGRGGRLPPAADRGRPLPLREPAAGHGRHPRGVHRATGGRCPTSRS